MPHAPGSGWTHQAGFQPWYIWQRFSCDCASAITRVRDLVRDVPRLEIMLEIFKVLSRVLDKVIKPTRSAAGRAAAAAATAYTMGAIGIAVTSFLAS